MSKERKYLCFEFVFVVCHFFIFALCWPTGGADDVNDGLKQEGESFDHPGDAQFASDKTVIMQPSGGISHNACLAVLIASALCPFKQDTRPPSPFRTGLKGRLD